MHFYFMGIVGFLLVGTSNLFRTFATETTSQQKDEYWGPDAQPRNIDESIKPFKIDFDKQMIDDLKRRLNNTRKAQPSMKNESWTYGVNSDFIGHVVSFWLTKYDFQKSEERLNQYPQFITNIQGLDIHFLHVKPKINKDTKIEVLPLYVQHGWLGSVVEFFQIIPMLTTVHTNRSFVFEMIIPSLPGFGYSSVPAKPGLSVVEITEIMRKLMLRLGFTKWYTHGGDWGSFITADMAVLYPQNILGMHTNWCLVLNPLSFTKEAIRELPSFLLNWSRIKSLVEYFEWLFEEIGFIFIQGTKPDSIGVGFSDSPAGLAGYILEKFVGSSRRNTLKFGNSTTLLKDNYMDDLLDNIMLYWVPNKATSAMRHHAEYLSKRNFMHTTNYAKVTIPSACSKFPFALINLPESLLRDRFVNMVRYSEMPRGGHFPGMEEPQLLADAIWAAVEKMRDQERRKKCKKFLWFFGSTC